MAAGIEVPQHPSEHPVPWFLYKYFPPERFHVLTDCRLRFTQRHLFPDDREFRPEVRDFGTEEGLRGFIAADGLFSQLPESGREALIQIVLRAPNMQRRVTDIAQGALKTPDLFVTLCLAEQPNINRMWEDYTAHGQGFVVEFDTRHPGFSLLASPGRLGKVTYADEPLHTFLGNYGPDAFFRKRTRFAFEAEWRSIRAMERFQHVILEDGKEPVYLSPFDPNCVTSIYVRPNAASEMKLRILASIDCRYRHTVVRSAK